LHTTYVPRGQFNELTDERFVVAAPQANVAPAKAATASVKQSPTDRASKRKVREEIESVKVLALEAENQRLKGELDDLLDTVDIFKKVIMDAEFRKK
jgi:NADH-quinone oxidoreductase subunit G/NADP-reducing hydrogenase subunit HndD